MGTALAAAFLLVALTPEEEVEAWQPPVTAGAHERATPSKGAVRAATVLLPLAAIVVGTATGVGVTYVLSNGAGFNGTVAAWTGLLSGVAAFDALLALGLGAFLPAGLPAWTTPVAVASATAAGAAGLLLGSGLSFAYVSVVYAGSDCVCGADLLAIPVVIGGLTAIGAVAGTTLTVMAAEME